MPRHLLLFLLFAMLTGVVFARETPTNGYSRSQFNTVRIDGDFEVSDLKNHTYVFSTEDSTGTVEELWASPKKYRLFPNEVPDLGMDSRYHWISFRVKNAGVRPRKLVSLLFLNELDDVSFFVVDTAGRVVERYEHFNSYTHLTKKPIPNTRFAFPISLPAGSEVSVFWRIQRAHGSVVFPLRLYDIEAFYTWDGIYDLFASLSYGLLAFTSVLAAILYLTTRRSLLLYYAGYCFFYLILCLSNEGLLKQVFHFGPRYVEDNARLVISSILIFFIIRFSSSFLKIDSYVSNWVRSVGYFLSGWALVFTVAVIVIPISSLLIAIFYLNVFVTFVYVAGLMSYGMIQKKRVAFIFFLALFPLVFTSIWLALAILFNVNITWLYFEIVVVQTIIEFVILGLEMGYRLISEREDSLLRLNLLKQKFTSEILQAQDTERQRIAADLHDDLGGTLAAIRIKVARARNLQGDVLGLTRELEEILPLINKSNEDLRRISHNLMPPEFERIGLEGSVQQLIASLLQERPKFEFKLTGGIRKFPLEISLNIYRVISELVQNIHKHANADRASVQLLYFDEYLRVVVEDDGVGNTFTSHFHGGNSGIGLKNNSLRTEYIGASLWRESTSAGTLIVIEIPYARDNNAFPGA